MNISSFNILVANKGWIPVRQLNDICQYKNLFTGRILTVTIPNEPYLSVDTIRKLINKFN